MLNSQKLNKKRFIIMVVIMLIIVNAVAYVVGSYMYPPKIEKIDFKLRVGIPPTLSEKYNKEKWDKYFKYLQSKGINFTPCYTNSYEDAIQGFLHNSLDLIYVNPITFLKLKEPEYIKSKESIIENLFMHTLDPEDKAGNRGILITLKTSNMHFISHTKNMRITFTDKNSMFGYIIPEMFLREKLNVKLDDWFSKVEFSITKDQALMNLIKGYTDVIAIDALTLRNLLETKSIDEKTIQIIWLSQIFPENLLCINKNYKHKEKLKKILHSAIIFYKSQHITKGNRIIFNEPDYGYKKSLKTLTKYLQ